MKEYIEHQGHDDGGEFWPIVKKVRIFLPNSKALSTGAVLVDLPGFGDSNVARSHTSDEVRLIRHEYSP